MKKLFLILLALSSSILVFSQGVWTPRTSFPDSGYIQGISGFSIGNNGYAGLGQNGNTYFDDFWRFNVSNNSWAKKASFPGRARVEPACFVIGTKAYLVTGSVTNAGTCVNECWEYDTATDTWTQKANFPGSARVYAVGFAIDSLGYVGTGANELGDFTKDFYAYHPTSNTWTRIADCGGIARSADCGFSVNGKGYVCFGQDSNIHYYTDMWEFDPVADTWTQKADYPGPKIYCASGFVVGTNIYVGSGDTAGFGFDPQFWKYNTLTDVWTEVASIPGTGKIQGVAFAVADSGYYGLGADISLHPSNNLNRFYPDTSTGTNEIRAETNISVFPNPLSTSCTILLPTNTKSHVLLALTDMEGRGVETDIASNSSYFILKRNNLSAGVYILSVKYNNEVFHKKLIITN
jgi:N-acetylneuraminic acid mutarotase